jgi:TP901 family phage tail tape measure protein
MAGKTPEIQADALLNLVLDEASLRNQLTKALGTSIKEAASNAPLGDAIVSPENLRQIRSQLAKTFREAGKELGEAVNIAQSDSIRSMLDRTRRDTVKKFERDMNDLLSGKGRSATRSLPALPQLGKEMQAELRSALRLFGADSLRSGSYQQRGPQIIEAQRNVAEINKLLKELGGLPAVAAKDLQKIRAIVNDKDSGKYLRMQASERASLAKSSQALQLQTQNLNRLASSLSKMGFGELASEVKAANQARRQLVSDFTRVSSPPAVEAQARREAQRLERESKSAERRRLDQWYSQAGNRLNPLEQVRQNIARASAARRMAPDTAEQRRLNQWFTEAGNRLNPLEQVRQNIARAAAARQAAPDSAEQRRLNQWFTSPDRNALGPLDMAQQNIMRAAAARQAQAQKKAADDLARQNELIRRQGDRMVELREAALAQQAKENAQQAKQMQRAQEQQRVAQANAGKRTASYQDAQRILQGLGGYGGLQNPLDIGIVRGGLTTAYRQAQAAMGQAGTVYGQDSPQYRAALGDLTRIRGERDQLAARIREIRASGSGGGGAGGMGPGGGRGQAWNPGNLLRTFSNYAIGYGGLYQLLSLVTQLKTEVIELDRAFYSIKAITQATDIEMKSIARSIREVALNTNFTTREIAGATELLGQAGVLPQDMDRVLSATARFASATNSQLAVAADLMTTVRTVFKEVEESTIADQLTKAINLSKLTAEDLKTILSLTAQTANSYNVSLDQLLAATTTLRNAGIKPSTVATGLRQAMLEIFNPDTATTKALGKRYAEMGEAMDPAAISQRFFGFTNAQNPLLAALGELRRIGFTDEGQKTLQRGVDIRAFNAIQGLLQNFKELEEAESKITFGQAAAEGAEIQMQSLSASLENLGASVVVLAEQLSNGLVRQLANGAKEATNLIERLTELDIELRATGAGSLNDVVSGALAGGIAGAMSGTGFRQRLIGGVAGATAGGYLSGGYQFGDDGFSAGDAAGIAATLLLIGRFVSWVGTIGKAVAPVAGALGTAGTGAGAAAAAGGARLLPVIGWIITALTVFETIADLIPESEAKKLAAQANAAQARAAKVSQRLSENTALTTAFDPNAENPAPGTASEGFAKYRAALDNYQISLGNTFGELAEGTSNELSELLKTYVNTSFSRRGEVRSRIEQLLGRSLSDDISDKVLFDLGQQREAVEATVSAYVDNTRQLINGVTERIRAARETGAEITAKDAAFSQAFSENADELLKILDGDSGLGAEQIQERLREFYERFVEIVDERPALRAEEQRKQMTALSEQLAATLAASDNSAEIATAISQIGNSLEYVSLTAAQRLTALQDGINKGIASIDKQIEEVKSRAPGSVSQFLISTGLFYDRRTPEQIAKDQQELNTLQGNRDFLVSRGAAAQAEYQQRLQRQREENQRVIANSADNAANLISGFNQDPRIGNALFNDQMLKDVGLTAQQIKLLSENRGRIQSGDANLLGELASTRMDEQGNVVPSDLYQKLDKVFNLLASNLDRVSEAELRRQRDEKNLIGADLLGQRIGAQTEIKKAEYGKNFALLASDSPNNPVVQLFDAQRQILEKELAQAQAKAEDASKDGSKSEVARQQAVLEAQAKLDTLALERAQELEKYQAKLKTAGEQATRQAENEAKKQARIAVTQTGIEQRKTKMDFDEAVRTGDVQGFLDISRKYEEVQAKLRSQLEDELKARGLTTSQIMDEIKLREELNKPLAEQVQYIRSLASSMGRQMDLRYRDIGSGPDLGSKFNTAYLGADGFTTEEQAAAAIRDILGTRARMAEVQQMLNNPVFQRDAETIESLRKEFEELEYQLGATQAALDKMTAHPADSIYSAFSPRNLLIELQSSQYNFQNLGDNLRTHLGSAIDEIGDGLARAINEGRDFSEVLKQIINQAATSALGDLFKTNLREGIGGLIKGGSEGGAGGIFSSIGAGIGNFFGFGNKGGAPAAAAGKEGSTAQTAGGFAGMLGKLFGVGTEGGMSSVATMNVQAGSVTVVGAGGGAPGVPGMPNIPTNAGAAGGAPAGIGNGAGGAGAAAGTGGSWMGALGGAGMGMGIGAALGGAVGGKNGSKWGAVLGALAGAYFGFGMAGGGRITKSGLVVGSGKRGVDSVPVSVSGTGQMGLLAPGEGVLNVKAMDALPPGWIDAANSGKLFRKAVGGVIDDSYTANQRAQSVAKTAQAAPAGAPQVNVKNVNITDPSQVYAALQTREGEDILINRLKARGALEGGGN